MKRRIVVTLGFVSLDYEHKLHMRGLCTGDLCPFRPPLSPAPRPPRES